MRVLLIHNRYRRPGGEDEMARREHRLLLDAGHTPILHEVTNDDFRGPLAALRVAVALPYSKRAHSRIAQVLADTMPDVVHLHNIFPLLTPSILDACAQARLPVVHTLHNYRLLCANGLLFRDSAPCELCIAGSPYTSVRYGCYRGSRLGSLAVARMLSIHRRRMTWQTKVDRYIALTSFGKALFVRAGLPADKICVKPNFTPSLPVHARRGAIADYALFVGRLTPQKGVGVLLAAWQEMPIDLHVVGSGPLSDAVKRAAAANSRIQYLGHLDRREVDNELAAAAFLVFPSLSYETFGLALIEALAQGTPIVASRIGAAAEIVHDGETGLHFTPDDPSDLAEKAAWLAKHPAARATMGERGYRDFLRHYTAERNLAVLLNTYAEAQREAQLRYGGAPRWT